MIGLLEWHIEQGHTCWIFTARLSVQEEEADARYHIQRWLKDNGLPQLDITAIKRKDFQLFYDDRACRVYRNKGVKCCDIAGTF